MVVVEEVDLVVRNGEWMLCALGFVMGIDGLWRGSRGVYILARADGVMTWGGARQVAVARRSSPPARHFGSGGMRDLGPEPTAPKLYCYEYSMYSTRCVLLTEQAQIQAI